MLCLSVVARGPKIGRPPRVAPTFFPEFKTLNCELRTLDSLSVVNRSFVGFLPRMEKEKGSGIGNKVIH